MSLLTNTSAMTALQTLKSINKNLGMVQEQISTGKEIGSAKDNAAVWAISKVMESDVKGFKEISDSLALGESTVAVARDAAETITDLLTDIKGKVVAAQEENVDRDKIQADIDALVGQIGSVVGAAQFNGLNLIDGSSDDPINVLSSLDRGSDGSVKASQIGVARQNLSVTEPITNAAFGGTAVTDGSLAAGSGANAAPATLAAGGSEAVEIKTVTEGSSYRITLSDVEVNVQGGGTATGERVFEYVAGANDGVADVAKALGNQISAFFGAATDSARAYEVAVAGDTLTITNGTAAGGNGDINVQVDTASGGTPGSSAASGGLGTLQSLDVTTDSGATGALTAIDSLIDKSIDAAAAFGSVQGRIETQSEFIGKLTDNLKAGIGSLVDADMEEASARLQALQVQQQLGVQSLSIANQAPQSILSLFR